MLLKTVDDQQKISDIECVGAENRVRVDRTWSEPIETFESSQRFVVPSEVEDVDLIVENNVVAFTLNEAIRYDLLQRVFLAQKRLCFIQNLCRCLCG